MILAVWLITHRGDIKIVENNVGIWQGFQKFANYCQPPMLILSYVFKNLLHRVTL